MTYEQVVKALETIEDDCAAFDKDGNSLVYMRSENAKAILDIIKRQQAEIERLQSKLINSTHIHVDKSAFEECCYNIETAKAEAIEEVLLTLEAEAESSDKFICEYDDSKEQKAYNQALWKAYNLVKEMTEGNK